MRGLVSKPVLKLLKYQSELWVLGWILISSLLNGISAVEDSLAVKPKKYITISYWNDDFLYRNIIEDIIPKGEDDRVTAALLIEYGTQDIDIRFHYKILTSRELGYRTDLVSIGYLKNLERWSRYFCYGFGLMGNGNLGGSTIQNAYHRLNGYDEVRLTYLEQIKVGVYISGLIQKHILWSNRPTVVLYLQPTLGMHPVVNSIKTGASVANDFTILKSSITGRMEVVGGFNHHFVDDRFYKSIFSSGVMYGSMLSLVVFRQYLLSGWIMVNHYGHHDYHFGMTIAWRINGAEFGNLFYVLLQ